MHLRCVCPCQYKENKASITLERSAARTHYTVPLMLCLCHGPVTYRPVDPNVDVLMQGAVVLWGK